MSDMIYGVSLAIPFLSLPVSNQTIGTLVLKFASLEQVAVFLARSDKWLKVEVEEMS